MRYAALRPIDISNGEGIGVALFTQGCSIHCKGCFQPQTWDFYGGEVFTQKTEEILFEYLANPVITRFSILGGEPLERCNWEDISRLLREVRFRFPHIKVWLYTGYDYERVVDTANYSMGGEKLKEILDNVDVLVAGPFIEDEKDLGLKWCGSSNQEIIRFDQNKK